MASLFEWLTNPFGTEIQQLLTQPSPEAEATFAELTTRWLSLEAWGASKGGFEVAAPSAASQHQAWVAFRDNWVSGKPDVTFLQAATADLYNAEQTAEPLGYHNPFTATPVRAPDVTQDSTFLKAFGRVDDTVKRAETALSPKNIPWWAYVVGVGVAVTAAGVAAIALRATPQATLLRRVAGEEKP